MPSGAKKRKAVKKKIRNEAHNGNRGTVDHSQVENEPRSQDGRESDGETEREEEDQKREFDGEDEMDPEEAVKEANLEEESVVDVLREVKSEVDVDDVVNENPHGDPSVENGISGSEVAVEKEQAVIEELEELRGQDYKIPESMPDDAVVKPAEYLPEAAVVTISDASIEEISNAMEKRIPDVESVKQVVSLAEDVNLVTESAAVENLVISNGVEPELKGNGNEVLQSLDEKDKVLSITTDIDPGKIEEEAIPMLADNSVKSSTIIRFSERENEDQVPKPESSGAPAVFNSPLVVVVKEEPFQQLKDQIGAVAVDTSHRVDDIEGLKINEHSEEQVGAPAVGENCSVEDVASMRTTEEQAVAPAVDTSLGVDDVKDLHIHEQSEEQMGAPVVDASQRMEQFKELEAQENLDGQPLISSAPRAVQRTSWMSCCGLFEVFSGSHR